MIAHIPVSDGCCTPVEQGSLILAALKKCKDVIPVMDFPVKK